MNKTIIMLLLTMASVTALVTDTNITTNTGTFNWIIYENGTALNLRYAPIGVYSNVTLLQTFRDNIYTNVSSLQSISGAYYTNISNLQTFRDNVYSNVSSLQTNSGAYYTNISNLQSSNTTTNQRIDSLNSTRLTDVTSANTYIGVTGTLNKTLTFSETILNQTIATALATTYYPVTNYNVSTGTGQGTITKMTAHDDEFFNVSESASDIVFYVNVTNTSMTTFNQMIIYYKTIVGEADSLFIFLWDYGSSSWEGYGSLTNTNGLVFEKVFTVSDPASHVSGNTTRILFNTTNGGSRTDKWQFDYIAVSKGVASQIGVELDPQSIHRDGTIPLSNNWDAGEYNITATTFKGNLESSSIIQSGGFGSTGITMTNGDYWGDGNLYILGNITALAVTQQQMNSSIFPSINNTWTIGNASLVYLGVYATTFYEGTTALNLKYATITTTGGLYTNVSGANTRINTVNATALSLITNMSGVNTRVNTVNASVLSTITNVTALQTFRDNIYTNMSAANTRINTVNASVLSTITNVTALQTFRDNIYTNVSTKGNVTGYGTNGSIAIWSNATNLWGGSGMANLGVSLNLTAAGGGCVNFFSGGRLCGNSVNTWLTSPDGATYLNISNTGYTIINEINVTSKITINKAVPFYTWYFNSTLFDCVNATGTIYNRGNATLTCT